MYAMSYHLFRNVAAANFRGKKEKVSKLFQHLQWTRDMAFREEMLSKK